METKQFNLEAQMQLSFDPESPEFTEALASYQEVINPEGDQDDMLKYVALNLLRFGVERMVEGVGYVQHENHPPVKENWCGITVDEDEPDFEISEWQQKT